ncbi:MAG TPA: ATP-binding cassette domain-containing protein, partial [Thermoanaerobaculia bacterium]|nr:ATP-binding cassette domain-containing protein [Thermoanaerobaculia bacterium]
DGPPAGGAMILELADVRRRLAEFELALDLRVEQRATLVVGPAGAGKTTLLELIAGLLSLDAGRVTLDGRVLDEPARRIRVAPPQRGVGWVPQEGALFPHLDVAKNLFYGARRGGAGDPAPVLETLELRPLLARDVRTLSGGERRRVAIGRALLSGARLLLVDEPFSGLDPRRRERVAATLLRVRDELRIPTLCVSHDLQGLDHWAEEIVVLERGAIVDRGPASELLERDPDALRLASRPRRSAPSNGDG